MVATKEQALMCLLRLPWKTAYHLLNPKWHTEEIPLSTTFLLISGRPRRTTPNLSLSLDRKTRRDVFCIIDTTKTLKSPVPSN